MSLKGILRIKTQSHNQNINNKNGEEKDLESENNVARVMKKIHEPQELFYLG